MTASAVEKSSKNKVKEKKKLVGKENQMPMKKTLLQPQQTYFGRLVGDLMSRDFFSAEQAVASLYKVLVSVYEPRPGFWAELESDTVIRVFQALLPTLDPDVELDGGDSFRAEVDLYLEMMRFDERCAMRLFALPVSARPSGRERIYKWLMKDFVARGEAEYAEYLERDGDKGVRAVLEFMRALELGRALLSPEDLAVPSLADPVAGATSESVAD